MYMTVLFTEMRKPEGEELALRVRFEKISPAKTFAYINLKFVKVESEVKI